MTDTAASDHSHGLPEWRLAAKLRPPALPASLIDRPHLLDRLMEACDHRLLLISAPAGFGKSIALAQLHGRRTSRGLRTAWLSLRATDGEPQQFLSYLILALDRAGLDLGALLPAARTGLVGTPTRQILSDIGDRLHHLPGRAVLILDDYHLVASAHLDRLLMDILASCNDRLSLCISSRDQSGGDLSALIVGGDGIEFTGADLRFSDSEVQQAFGPTLQDAVLTDLQRKVEGWPVAVQLARLMLDNEQDQAKSVAGLHGHTGHLAAYLTDQVISRLSPTLQDFMLRTSILDTFDADLADAVCAQTSSRQYLKALAPLHALLVPLDNTHERFRYHHLFAECLQDLLRRRHAGDYETLHLRAARWLGDRAQYVDAVHHAAKAGHITLCADLICQAGGWELVLFGGLGDLEELLKNFPDADFQAWPRLQFARCYLAMKRGDIRLARAYFDAASKSTAFDPLDSDMLRDQINMRALLDSYEDEGLADPANTFLEETLSDVRLDDPITRGVLQCSLTLRLSGFGLFGEAEAQAGLAARAMREGNSLLGLNYCYLHLGLVSYYRGELERGLAHMERAADMAQDNFGADSGLKYAADLHFHALLYWRGDLDTSGVETLRRALDHIRTHDGWFESFALGFDALVHEALFGDQPEQAADLIEAMHATAAERGIARLRHLAEAFELRFLLRTDQMRAAARLFERVKTQAVEDTRYLYTPTWLIVFAASLACAEYLSRVGLPKDAMLYASRAHDITRRVDAPFFSLRALLLKARVQDAIRRRGDAIDAVLPALKMAASTEFRAPFRGTETGRILRAARSRIRNDDQALLMITFLNDLLGRERRDTQLLSDRELQVLDELALGRSNKEIAIALDMTENTVKFHLKNVFSKLKVSRRVQAVTTARELDLIS